MTPKTFSESLRTYKAELAVLLILLAASYYSIVIPMVMDWYNDPNYSHGFFVPLIAGYFVWQRAGVLKTTSARPDNRGLIVLIAGLLLLVFGHLATEYFSMRSSLIVVLAGTVLYLFGKDVLKGLALPLGYLFFMVPLPYIVYDAIAFPLRLFVTKCSVSALSAMDIPVLRDGCIIEFPNVTLNVANACSGVRSLMSLLALSVAVAYFTRTSAWKRWVIILSAIPITIITNAVRIIATGLLVQYWGQRAAEGFFHEFIGMVVFGLALALLVAVAASIRRNGK
ncbi:MAG: exosortase/archaeosortase family protein [Nitrospiraceae bacterium]|nr:exosortase/archaeosortase family protein [Nitrospiraceae bacterium]